MSPLIEDGAALPGPNRDVLEDPRTSFRQVQAQDAIIWTATLYRTYAQRIADDPADDEARAWFASDGASAGTFEFWCRTFGQDPQTIREHIDQLTREPRDPTGGAPTP